MRKGEKQASEREWERWKENLCVLMPICCVGIKNSCKKNFLSLFLPACMKSFRSHEASVCVPYVKLKFCLIQLTYIRPLHAFSSPFCVRKCAIISAFEWRTNLVVFLVFYFFFWRKMFMSFYQYELMTVGSVWQPQSIAIFSCVNIKTGLRFTCVAFLLIQ